MKRVTLNIGGKPVTFLKLGKSERYDPDAADKFTASAYKDLAEKLRKIYQEAADDLYMKQQSFLHAHEARVRKYRAQVERGEITEADFKAWMQGQLFQEKAWEQKRQQLAEAMVHVDEQAMRMINEGKTAVFGECANFIGWETERGAGADLGFGIYNSQAVTRLIRDNPNLLPRPTIDRGKDFAWYNDIISRAVTQGILQGEDLEGIMFRVALETGEKSLSAIKRNARTAYTGAQYAGELEGMRQAEALGVGIRKKWQCMLLETSRDAHAELDGQEVDIEEPFDSLLGPIMHPGDPNALPGNVYNCHCRMRRIYTKYPEPPPSDKWRNDMTYDKWKAMKEAKRRGGG